MVSWTTFHVVGALNRARFSFESLQLQVHPALRVLVPQLVIHELAEVLALVTLGLLVDLLALLVSSSFRYASWFLTSFLSLLRVTTRRVATCRG